MGAWIWLALSLYTGVFCAGHLKRNDTIEVNRKNYSQYQLLPYYLSYIIIAYITFSNLFHVSHFCCLLTYYQGFRIFSTLVELQSVLIILLKCN